MRARSLATPGPRAKSRRARGNDYSIPHTLVRQPLTLVASEHTVRLLDGATEVARHPRSCDRGQRLDSKQAMAVQTATSRGQFEMNCPAATGTVLSREVVQPVLQGPMMVGGNPAREYKVGVAGCGKRTTFVVICPDEGDGCFATSPGRFIRE